MSVLASVTYDPSPTFAVPRPYIWGLAFGWWDGTLLLTPGNPCVFQEIPFGGYTVTVKVPDWVYAWSNKTFRLNQFLEDLYAEPPGGGTPVSVGNCLLQYEYDATYEIPIITLSLDTPDSYYWFQEYPAAPPTYWQHPYFETPSPPFHFPP